MPCSVPSCSPAGSSPRVWGTQENQLRREAFERFIPTRVGNTAHCSTGSGSKPVHPHACGEHRYDEWVSSRDDGSSPRVWGTQPVGDAVTPIFRFIPTRVGNTATRQQGDRQ